jgi:formylglycine-generating enzyme required for sulfatase activity
MVGTKAAINRNSSASYTGTPAAMSRFPRLRFSLRTLVIAVLLAGNLSAIAAEPDAKPWPLWDGSESVADYAQRANLPPSKTLELGNGVKLELVLIPAGEFIMGTPEPEPVDEAPFRNRILMGQSLIAVSGGLLLVLLGVVVVKAIRQRRRPQYSLARFLVMVIAASVAVLSGAHWWQSAQALKKANAEYQAALARFKDANDWEKPAHKVTITTPFYIGKCEITQEQYQQVMGTNPSNFKGKSSPVETVSWDDAQEFCKKASEKTGQIVRLPFEAEWEHACRAGTKTAYYTGDNESDLDRAGWFYGNSKNTTHPAGGKVPNVWGVYDMHGNVWEWCQDWWSEAYKAEAQVDPQGPPEGQYRVLRGGSWGDDPGRCRTAIRLGDDPGHRIIIIGFRLVAVVPRTP